MTQEALSPEVGSFFTPVVAQLQALLTEASRDWRYWFAHVSTWMLVAKLKLWWDHYPEVRADRVTEAVATGMCFALSLWVFWEHQYAFQICLMNGLLNTYGYKFVVIVLERTGLSMVADKLKGPKYKISTRSVEQDMENSGANTPFNGDTVFLYRAKDGKTIAIKRSELKKYKVVG